MAEVRQDSSEESVGGLFQPDMVLASQFFGALRQRRFIDCEKRLMAAVLADAVDCYMKQAFNAERRAQHMFLEAEAWIFADGPVPWFFSQTPTESTRSSDRYPIALVYDPSKAASLLTTISLGCFARSVGVAVRSRRTMSRPQSSRAPTPRHQRARRSCPVPTSGQRAV
jgi:hypothetical protein